ncbi:GGDEF domain-containing protein [Pleionea sediminis]|uniref:GGDEF domain-containing protein n=1 Tax=Pleionea sediminis TaxID=2569479 RepID=UPI001185AF4A|nr:GGDEF domain-containing protein [Pleionea sediminis]
MAKSQNAKTNPKFVGRISLQALTWLRDKNIPAQPLAYAVSYEYVQKQLTDLVEHIDEHESEGNTLDENTLFQLFREFVLPNYIDFEGFNQCVNDIVTETDLAIVNTRGQLKSYSGFLNETKLKLAKSKELDTENIVGLLTQNTETTELTIKQLESQLLKISEDVRMLEKKFSSIMREARQDPLTKLLNRTALHDQFEQLIRDPKVDEISLCVADIDLFKNFNDQHGHLIGDRVLKVVAKTLKSSLKGSDVVSRYGGEEFVILLPNTNTADAVKLMNAIRREISQKELKVAKSEELINSITMSFGVAELAEDDNFLSLFDRADRALYRSKQNGRNRVCSEY